MPDFQTQLFLPAWWGRAFDAAISRDFDELEGFAKVRRTGLVGCSEKTELNLLALALPLLQEQILNKDEPAIKIPFQAFSKNALNRFEGSELYRLIGQTRLLRENEPTVPLFKSETMNSDESVSFDLAKLGLELLCGISHPYLDLLRTVDGTECASTLIGEQGPLTIPRAIWMELKNFEQQMLFKLQKAMQWESAWLHFEGVFGKDLFELLGELNLRGLTRGKKPAEKWFHVLLALKKLGEKLSQHGIIHFDQVPDYLAAGDHSGSSLLLLWQAHQSVGDEGVLFRDRVLEKLEQHIDSKKLGRILLANLGSEENVARFGKIEEKLDELLDREPDLNTPFFREFSSSPLRPKSLFLDWSVRLLLGHDFPLSDEIRETELGEMLLFSIDQDLGKRFKNFVGLLNSKSALRDFLASEPLSYLANPQGKNDDKFSHYLQSVGKTRFEIRASNEKQLEQPSSPNRIKPAANFNVKKLAAEELQSIKKNRPDRYDDLKSNYLASLDEQKRRIILDVKSRMQPQMFDNHLKHSLIKFMIDNPSQWKGCESPKVSS